MNKVDQTKILAEGTVVIALTVILKDVLPPIVQFPQGGSVTAAGMVPLLWFSLRRGLRSGLEICTVYGLVHMVLGGFVVDPVQALLGYPIAFGALGLAGIFARYGSAQGLKKYLTLVGVGVGILGRFVAHFIEGVFFFAIYAPEGVNPAIYSAIYNGSYLLVELGISVFIMSIIVNRRLLRIYL